MPFTRRAVILAALLMPAALGAQEPPRRPFREAVTLAVDPDAARALLTLEDRWAAGQWAGALDVLIELDETRGRSLVQVDAGVPGGVARYVQVQQACEQLVAALPPEGLALYRVRVAPRAERLWDAWQQTGDVAPLERLVEQMFYSRLGDQAVWALGKVAWDRGHMATARRLWRTLLPAEAPREFAAERRYPDPRIPAAEVAARLILCDLVDGRWEAARAALATYRAQYPEAEGTLAGRPGGWADLLAEELQSAADWTPPVPEDDLPTFGGSAARTRRFPRAIDLGGELWSIPLPSMRLPGPPRPSVFPVSSPLAFHPAVVDDVVFLNDGVRIFAWRLDSGLPAWGEPGVASAQIFPVAAADLPLEPRRPVSGSPAWTVTVSGGRLYARMGSAVTTPSPLELRDHRTTVVCLDISQGEGRLVWSKSGDELATALAGADELPAWSWEGTPLAQDGRLYAVLSRRRPQLEWSVLCLDAETGLVLWHHSVGISRPTPPDHENLATQLLLTAGDGQLYLSTDGGAVIALDALDGHVRWAVTYESDPPQVPTGRPWPRLADPPCVFADGLVFAAPLDSQQVFCLDAATGQPRWQRPMTDRIRHLLGLADGLLLLSGDALWAVDVGTGDIRWAVQPTEPEQFSFGRGCLAGEVIYWPSREALSVVDLRTGRVLREQPLLTPDARRFGGHVVVSGGVLLVASTDRLTAYGEYAAIEETLEQRLSRRPDDARVRRRLAEIALARGNRPRASEWLASLPRKPPVELPGPPQTVSGGGVSNRPASPPRSSPAEPERTDFAGYWVRSWQRPLDATAEQAIVPEGRPAVGQSPVVLVQSAQVDVCDRRTGEVRWSAAADRPVLWAGYDTDRLLWATAEELCAAALDTGQWLYRLPWRSELRRNHPRGLAPAAAAGLRILQQDEAVILADATLGLLACDRRSGEILWRRQTPVSLDTLAAGGRLVAWHPGGRGRAEWRSQATGQLVFSDPSPTDCWQRAPVWSSRDEAAVVVDGGGRLVSWSATGTPRWEPTDPGAHAHAAPWVFNARERWYAVLDGRTLVQLRDDGSQAWSAPLAAMPLTDPPRQLAVSAESVIAAGGGEARCLDLNDGHTQWQRALTDLQPQRIALVGNDAILLPVAPQSPLKAVELISMQTGQPRQRIRLPEPGRQVRIASDDAGWLLATDAALIAFTPQTSVRLAQDR